MSLELLENCRQESVELAKEDGLMKDAGYGRGTDYTKDKQVRGDRFMWLTSLFESLSFQGTKLTHIKDLLSQLTQIETMINKHAKEDDKISDKEIQLAVYNGNGEYYLRHKDAFRIDSNNLKDGEKLRKFTVIVYLNPDLEKVKEADPKN